VEVGFERSIELLLWYSSLMYHLSLTFDPCQHGPDMETLIIMLKNQELKVFLIPVSKWLEIFLQ
jgi:hypothetical protein